MHFNPPPGWPAPPDGWQPEEGWTPPADWPPIPPGWPLWSTGEPRLEHHQIRDHSSTSRLPRPLLAVGAALLTVVCVVIGIVVVTSRDSPDVPVGHPGDVEGSLVGFLPDGTLVARDDGHIRFWNVATSHEVGKAINDISPQKVVLGPTGRRLAVIDFGCQWTSLPCDPGVESGGDGARIRLYDVSSASLICTIDQEHLTNDVAFDATESRLLIAGYMEAVTLWDANTCRPAGRLSPMEYVRPAEHVEVGPDGTVVVSALRNLFGVWDLTTMTATRQVQTDQAQNMLAVALSADGSTYATGSLDKTVRLWDLSSGRQMGSALDLEGGATSMSFSPDGRMLAVGGQFEGFVVWDVRSGRKIDLPSTVERARGDVDFSPDGSKVAFSYVRGNDSVISLFDIPSTS